MRIEEVIMGQGFDIEYLFVVENICGHKYFCIIFIKEFDVYHCWPSAKYPIL